MNDYTAHLTSNWSKLLSTSVSTPLLAKLLAAGIITLYEKESLTQQESLRVAQDRADALWTILKAKEDKLERIAGILEEEGNPHIARVLQAFIDERNIQEWVLLNRDNADNNFGEDEPSKSTQNDVEILSKWIVLVVAIKDLLTSYVGLAKRSTGTEDLNKVENKS